MKPSTEALLDKLLLVYPWRCLKWACITAIILLTCVVIYSAVDSAIHLKTSEEEAREARQEKEAREQAIRESHEDYLESRCYDLRHKKFSDMTPNDLAELRSCAGY
jgi:hypothetical protein